MNEWIYESPDGGKTITRRPAARSLDLDRSLLVSNQTWWDMKDLQEISRQLIRDQALRDQHPALEELWQQYQTMKKLLNDK